LERFYWCFGRDHSTEPSSLLPAPLHSSSFPLFSAHFIILHPRLCSSPPAISSPSIRASSKSIHQVLNRIKNLPSMYQ
jgi:hypothetical protein